MKRIFEWMTKYGRYILLTSLAHILPSKFPRMCLVRFSFFDMFILYIPVKFSVQYPAIALADDTSSQIL